MSRMLNIFSFVSAEDTPYIYLPHYLFAHYPRVSENLYYPPVVKSERYFISLEANVARFTVVFGSNLGPGKT